MIGAAAKWGPWRKLQLAAASFSSPFPRAEACRNPRAEACRNPRAEACRNPCAEACRNPRAEACRNPRAEARRNPRAEARRNPRAEACRHPRAEARRNPRAEACGGRQKLAPRALLAILFLFLTFLPTARAQAIPYQRPVETAPQEKTIGGGYKTPAVQNPLPRDSWLQVLDVVVMAAAMGVSVWLVLKRRSRKWLMTLTAGSLAYFGFYRQGCVCPVGAIQNVAVALTDPRYSIPLVVTATFFLPLAIAVFFGRAFCGGVCALGAIQELVLLKPVQVPRRLDRTLGLLKYVYLGLAIFGAVRPALARDFLICRFDPFVGLFRRTGAPHMLLLGGAFLVAAMFVGRPYCRYLCPYGGLLAWCTRLARRGVTITPDKELDCGLCTEACPYGAIDKMRAVRRNCLYCARCYAACPRDGELAHAKAQLVAITPGGNPS